MTTSSSLNRHPGVAALPMHMKPWTSNMRSLMKCWPPARAGLTQEAVAGRMGTTKSAISRLESAGKHAPSVASLKKYAAAVGCTLKIELVPASAKGRKTAQPDSQPDLAR